MYRNPCYFLRRGSPGPVLLGMRRQGFLARRPGWSAQRHLEATQWKTVRTVTVTLRAHSVVAEVQEAGTATPRKNRRRPAVPVVANEPQRTTCLVVAAVAVARGRATRQAKTGGLGPKNPPRRQQNTPGGGRASSKNDSVESRNFSVLLPQILFRL